LINSNGGGAHFRELDVSNFVAFQETVAYAAEKVSKKGRLDIMVNNAGIPGFQPGIAPLGIHTESIQLANRIINVNLMGIWNGTKAAIEQMRKQEIEPYPCDRDVSEEWGDIPSLEEEDGIPRGSRGSVVNMGSIHGMIAGPLEGESDRGSLT